MPVPEAAPVVIISPEDDPRILGRRIIAAARSIGADRELLAANLHVVNCNTGTRFYKQTEGGHELTDFGTRILEETRSVGARMLIIDPLAEWHDGPENDNQHMHRVMADARDFAGKRILPL